MPPHRLDAAARPDDMNLPGYGFHPLKGTLPALRMTQAELAERLPGGVAVERVRAAAREARDDRLAIRIARLTGTTPESWLRMQEALDLWTLMQDDERYRDIEPVPA